MTLTTTGTCLAMLPG